MRTGLLVIDMQVGLFEGERPCHDADQVVARVNAVAKAIRARGGVVVWIQHTNEKAYAPGERLWKLLPGLETCPEDLWIGKTASDCFYKSDLDRVLRERGIERVVVTGCATELCVDTTTRVAASRDYHVVVVADGHTTRDRPVLCAPEIIAHHNWVWSILAVPGRSMRVVSSADLLSSL